MPQVRSTSAPRGRRSHVPAQERPFMMPSSAAQPQVRDVLRIVSDPRTPVFVTEYAGGRRVYGYWRPLDADGGGGGCCVPLSPSGSAALPGAGRITLGAPVMAPTKPPSGPRPARTPAAA